MTAKEVYRMECAKRHLRLPRRDPTGRAHRLHPAARCACPACGSVECHLSVRVSHRRLVTTAGVLMRCQLCNNLFRTKSRVAAREARDHLLHNEGPNYRAGQVSV